MTLQAGSISRAALFTRIPLHGPLVLTVPIHIPASWARHVDHNNGVIAISIRIQFSAVPLTSTVHSMNELVTVAQP